MPSVSNHSRTEAKNDQILCEPGPVIKIRSAYPSDKNLIYSTWLKGLYFGNDWFREIKKDLYFEIYSEVIQKILSRPNIVIQVACLADDPETVLSYAILEKKEDSYALHWVFTKSSWRKLGLAKKLIPENISYVTHLTKVGKSIKPKKWPFIPFF